MEADRDDADYEPMSVFTEDIARADLADAERFVDEVAKLIPP